MKSQLRSILTISVRAVVVIAVLAAGVSVATILMVTAPQPNPDHIPATPPAVQVMRTAIVPVRRQFTGFGTAAAMDTADVPAQITAIVQPLPETTEAGRTVTTGDTLITLDATDFAQQLNRISEQINAVDAQIEQLSIDRASAERRATLAAQELDLAQRDFDRVQRLYNDGDARETELEQVQQRVFAAERVAAAIQAEFDAIAPRRLQLDAQRKGLEAELQIAQRNIDRAVIAAPIDGVIESVDVEQGEQVSPGVRIARIVDVRRIEVPIRLATSARPHLHVGDEAVIRRAGGSGRDWTGRIMRIGPSDDAGTRTFPVYIEVMQRMDETDLLTPGTFVEARIIGASTHRRMVVPRRAVAADRVKVVREDRIADVPVVVEYYVQNSFETIGLSGEDYWAVLVDPIDSDALVVLNGAADLASGEVVRPVVMNETRTLAEDGRSPMGD